MIDFTLPVWMLPILGSAIGLGFYDLCKKAAVQKNSVMPVLFFATLCGSLFFLCGEFLFGDWRSAVFCSAGHFRFILLKSLIVASSWICVYYAMRDLPVSIASPIRASSPLWTLFGAILLYGEIPTAIQALGMLCIFTGYGFFSMIGKTEGISWHGKGMCLMMLGTLIGACSGLYDKYLLGVIRIPRGTVQFWFSVNLVWILGGAMLLRRCFGQKHEFQWRWSIPLTGIVLILADYLYFYALSLPDTPISLLSLVRRCNCIVTFFFGIFYFHEKNIRKKAIALAAILAGVLFLALGK